MGSSITAVSSSGSHGFSKMGRDSLTLLAGLGVEGDAHMGRTVKHRSRVARDPSQPNLRQVHLIHSELFAELAAVGHRVLPGELGENVTTSGIDLLDLPTGTLLHLGDQAVVEVTGLRNPCTQIDDYQEGLLRRVVHRSEDGMIIRKAGVMSIVHIGGVIRPGDAIEVVLPQQPYRPLQPV